MKIAISSQQIVHFRKYGHVRFEEIPFPSPELSKNTACERDLWRSSSPLKRWITQTVGPIALDLVEKTRLRLACDQRIQPPLPPGRFQDLFCFQGLVAVCVISTNPEGTYSLDIFEPSNLTSLLPQEALYLVAIGRENTIIVNNTKDPHTFTTRNLGYVFGDALGNEFHPLLMRK